MRMRMGLAVALALVALLGCCAGAMASAVRLTGLAPVLPGARSMSPAAVAAQIRAEKSRVRGISLTPSRSEPYWGCPESLCDEIIDPQPLSVTVDGRHAYLSPQKKEYEGSGERGGLAPKDLVSAYKIPTDGGEGQTVAIVDAYGFSEAEGDLATYRSEYKLAPCTKANGCFHQVNQVGEEANYPPDESGWDGEQSLDIEMVSAACPACRILLVDANDARFKDLEEGVDTAARLGAVTISNSYGSPEELCEEEEGCEERLAAYDHPGVMITVAAGDYGYDDAERGAEAPSFPASLGSVVAVGGTNLRKKKKDPRGWEDTVWSRSGSGCSLEQPKPAWQHDTGCATRMDNDIAAVGSCETPVSVYDGFRNGWELVCGTSVSSPLLAGIEAHASAYARSLPGADAFYQDPAATFDATEGSNGSCTPPEEHAYYCNAEGGYDGPTGNGTPDGPLQLSGAPPAVSGSDVTGLTGAGATLEGSVTPQGAPTTYQFEYGTSTAYGSTAPASPGSIEATYESRRVSAAITGLQAGATYHFRLSATNAAGTSHGADRVFVTAPPSVTEVVPDEGPARGGGTITIHGRNLLGASAVRFGTRPATYFRVISDEAIEAIPPGGRGSTDITVTTPDAGSEPVPSDRYSYEAVGPVLAWGENDDSLGDGLAVTSGVPVEVLNLPEALALAAGGPNLALLRSGRVMAWGENVFGEVGDGTRTASRVPVPVCAVGAEEESCPDGPYLEGVKAVAAGLGGSMALLRTGKVLTWGWSGFLGRGGSQFSSDRPAYVCDAPEAAEPNGLCKEGEYLTEVSAIAAGEDFDLALLRNGTVVGWGEYSAGQLGNGSGTPEGCHEPELYECGTYPTPIPDLSEVTAISAGLHHALALLKARTVVAWGEDTSGELGNGASEGSGAPSPVCAAGEAAPCAHQLEDVRAVSAGSNWSMALLENGTVATWGENSKGELGDGSLSGPEVCGEVACSRTPLIVPGLHDVRLVATGEVDNSPLAVTDAGEILSWGANGAGELGDGFGPAAPSPTQVCAAYAETPCTSGSFLVGEVEAASAGLRHDLISMASTPVITGLSPEEASGAGGTSVRITGALLSQASAVYFGDTRASSFDVLSPNEISAVAPAGEGEVEVSVETPLGRSATSVAGELHFRTAPRVSTGVANTVREHAATLSATVDPESGEVSECRFEWGNGPSLSSSAPCSKNPGAGTEPVSVSAQLTGLEAGARYRFRIVATNSEGTSYGAEETVRTLTSEPPELGRCTKLSGSASGEYSDSHCTKQVPGETGGPYEWSPGPGADSAFTAAGSTFSVERQRVRKGKTTTEHVLQCTSGSLAGTYQGSREIMATLTLKGCGREGYPANSAGSASGEIVSQLQGEIQLVTGTKGKSSPGVKLSNAEGNVLSYELHLGEGSLHEHVGGAIAAVLGSSEKMSSSFSLTSKASGYALLLEPGFNLKWKVENGEKLEVNPDV